MLLHPKRAAKTFLDIHQHRRAHPRKTEHSPNEQMGRNYTQRVRYKEYYLDDAEYVVVGFGTCGRIALTAVREARERHQSWFVAPCEPFTLSH